MAKRSGRAGDYTKVYSVLLTEPQAEVLEDVLRYENLKISNFFRRLFLQYLRAEGRNDLARRAAGIEDEDGEGRATDD